VSVRSDCSLAGAVSVPHAAASRIAAGRHKLLIADQTAPKDSHDREHLRALVPAGSRSRRRPAGPAAGTSRCWRRGPSAVSGGRASQRSRGTARGTCARATPTPGATAHRHNPYDRDLRGPQRRRRPACLEPVGRIPCTDGRSCPTRQSRPHRHTRPARLGYDARPACVPAPCTPRRSPCRIRTSSPPPERQLLMRSALVRP